MEPTTPVFETVLKRDRVVVTVGLGLVTATAWLYLLLGAGMDRGGEMMAATAIWSPGYALVMFIMWWVMMIAMMLPSAAPMILLYAAASRSHAKDIDPRVPALVLAGGYLLTWGVFSIAATALQWFLTSAGMLSPMMDSTSLALGGGLLVAAGIYQVTPLKEACLRHCKSPLFMVMGRWRPGLRGAFVMGSEHGVFCLGCCWVLMGLLFYGGVMNAAWIGGIAAYVLIEKLAPMGQKIGRYTGVLLIIWGIAVFWLASAT